MYAHVYLCYTGVYIHISGLYSKADIDEQKAIQDRTGALFFMVVNQAFGECSSVRVCVCVCACVVFGGSSV